MIKRILAENDLPDNAAELLEAAKREACYWTNTLPEQFDTNKPARQFAAAMLAHVRTGNHPYCVRSELGILRANAIVGRKERNSTANDLRDHHPGWAGRAERKGSALIAVWASDAQEGRAA